MPDIEQRLSHIEERLSRIEASLSSSTSAIKPGDHTTQPTSVSPPHQEGDEGAAPRGISVGNLLGWGGAAALVLATVYLIQLALTHGWLTPMRQVGTAYAVGIVLIAAGLGLRLKDRNYASYLPAGGVVILFAATYGAHIYYPLISSTTAIVAVIGICLVSLYLCRVFASDIYAFFAVIGSYGMPMLFPQLSSDTLDLAIYFSAWSLIFCVFSIMINHRSVLLLSLYLALIIFDLIWRMNRPDQWTEAVYFQCAQLLIFGLGTAVFSILRHAPMKETTARLYLPALLIFYTLQYSLLNKHLPAYAPWIAAGSALALLAIYLLTRLIMKQDVPGGRGLIVAYATLVMFHAGYWESVPDAWAGWAGLLVLPLVAVFIAGRGYRRASDWPVPVACAIIYYINFAGVISNTIPSGAVWKDALFILYPLEMYIGYCLSLRIAVIRVFRLPLIYLGHISAMSAAVYLLDERLFASFAWSIVATACLLISLRIRDRVLGQSALLILAAAAVKVLFYDLTNLTPLTRVFSLGLLGLTFYVGGWLYKKINFADSFASPPGSMEQGQRKTVAGSQG